MGNIAASYHRDHVSPRVDRQIFCAIGGVGIFCALTVILEMCEKLAGSTTTNWSAVRLMGPQIWLPLKTKEDYNVAVIILIFSIMYIASCVLLIYGGWHRLKDLALTWKLTESGVIMYQIIAAMITANMFSVADSVLLSVDTVLGVLALLYTRVAENSWGEEEIDGGEAEPEREESERSSSPTPVEIMDDTPGPSGISSREARRSLEAVPGPSGVPRPTRTVEQHPMREIDGDSDSLEEVAAVVEPPAPPPVIVPRSKKSSTRTAQVAVHSPPPEVIDITEVADGDRTLGSIVEESPSSSDQSRSSPSASPPRPSAKSSGDAQGTPGASSQVPSTSTAELASSEQPAVAEALAVQEASASTGKFESAEEKETVKPAEASPSAEARKVEPEGEAEPLRAQPVSSDGSKPSQPTPSVAAETSTTDAKTQETPSTVDSAEVAASGATAEADSTQVPADTGAAIAEEKTVVQTSKDETETTEKTVAGVLVTEVKDSTRM